MIFLLWMNGCLQSLQKLHFSLDWKRCPIWVTLVWKSEYLTVVIGGWYLSTIRGWQSLWVGIHEDKFHPLPLENKKFLLTTGKPPFEELISLVTRVSRKQEKSLSKDFDSDCLSCADINLWALDSSRRLTKFSFIRVLSFFIHSVHLAKKSDKCASW